MATELTFDNDLPDFIPNDVGVTDENGILTIPENAPDYEVQAPTRPKIPTTVDEIMEKTTEKWRSIRWDLLPPHVSESIDKDRVETILNGARVMSALEVPRSIMESSKIPENNRSSDIAQILHIGNMYKTYDIDRPIDYVSGAPWEVRMELSRADSDEEKERVITKRFGPDSVSYDAHGRLLFRNPQTGLETAIDDHGSTSFGDFVEYADHGWVLATTLGAAYATGGMTLKAQFAAHMAAVISGMQIREAVDYVSGENMESLNEILTRLEGEAVLESAFFGGGVIATKLLNRFRNPLKGGVTPKTVELVQELEELNMLREARRPSQDPLKPPLPAFNESPVLARAVGMLSKVPGGAGVMKRDADLFSKLINEEVDFILEGFKDLPPEVRLSMAGGIRRKLIEVVNEREAVARNANNARFTGVDPITGSRVMREGTEVALNNFKLDAGDRMRLVHTLAGSDPFIDPRNFKNTAKKFIGEIPRDAEGEVIEALNAGQKTSTLESLLRVKDSLNFAEVHSIRAALGDMLRGDRPLGDMSQGQVKQLYSALTQDIERGALELSRLSPGAPRVFNRARFYKEFQDFNGWYRKNHDLFNEKGGTGFEIIQANRTNPYGLVDIFLRQGNRHHWKQMEEMLSPAEMGQVREAAKDFLLSQNTTGDALMKKMHAMGPEVMESILGNKRSVSLWNNFANWQVRAEQSMLRRFTQESNDANRVFSTHIASNQTPQGALEVREALGKNSREWKQIQLAYTSRLIGDATDPKGVLNGEQLLNSISGDNKDMAEIILGGTPLGKNLRLVADIAAASTAASKSTAGSLAGGLYTMMLLTGKLVAFASAGSFSWASAKFLTSKTAHKMFTREPIGKVSEAWIRQATIEVQRIATGADNSEHFAKD